jgi:hypothetical protein
MRDKSFVERLVPAINLQLMQRNVWMLDVNPSLGYRFQSLFFNRPGVESPLGL